MSEIILNLEPDLSLEELRKRIECISLDYSLAVIEGIEDGHEYPDASANTRFLSGFIFSISCAIEDKRIFKYEDHD